MIKKVEKYRVDYDTIPKQQEIEDLIVWCRNCKLNQVIVELEYGFSVRYYSDSERHIVTGISTRVIAINGDSNVKDILTEIIKFKDKCDYENSQPIPV